MKSLLVATLLLVSPVFANVIETVGNHPQPGQERVFFSRTQTGQTVWGTDLGGDAIQFTSRFDILTVKAGTSALNWLTAGPLQDVSISIPGVSFSSIILNPYGTLRNDSLAVSVFATDPAADTIWGIPGGNNYLTVTTTGTTEIDSVWLRGIFGGYKDLQNIEIVPAPVPEPSTLLLAGAGLLGVVGWMRRLKG